MTWRSRMASVVATASMAAVVGVGPGTPVLAASRLWVSADIGACFSVWVPPLTRTTVVWKAADGRRKALLEQTSDTNGMVSDASVCSTESVAVGDRITVTAGSASRTLTVPVLTATFDRVSGHVRGQAPAGDRLLIVAGHPAYFQAQAARCSTTVWAHSDGTFDEDVQGISDLHAQCPQHYTPIAGDEAVVSWTSHHADIVRATATAQVVTVTLGTATVSGFVLPAASTTITLRDGVGALKGTAPVRGGSTGAFKAVIRDAIGHRVPVAIGDKVSGGWAGPQHLTVPDLHFMPIPIYHWLFGWCLPQAPFRLELHHGSESETWYGTTDTAGETPLAADPGHVTAGELMSITCALASGDRVSFSRLVP